MQAKSELSASNKSAQNSVDRLIKFIEVVQSLWQELVFLLNELWEYLLKPLFSNWFVNVNCLSEDICYKMSDCMNYFLGCAYVSVHFVSVVDNNIHN